LLFADVTVAVVNCFYHCAAKLELAKLSKLLFGADVFGILLGRWEWQDYSPSSWMSQWGLRCRCVYGITFWPTVLWKVQPDIRVQQTRRQSI